MHVRAGRTSADAAVANDLAALDAGTGDGGESGHMGVPGGDPKAVVDDDEAAVTCVIFSNRDDAVLGGVPRCAITGGTVHAGLECAFPAERVQALAEAVRDVPHHRPDGRRVG